jgi:anti-anti-sigma factor
VFEREGARLAVRQVDAASSEALQGRVVVMTNPVKGATLVTLTGEFDIETVPSIESCLRRALGPFYYGENVVVDLSSTTFVDSTFIGFLVRLASKTRQSGRELILVRPLGHVRSVLLLVGLPNLVPVYDSLQRAFESLRVEDTPLIPPPLPWQPAD